MTIGSFHSTKELNHQHKETLDEFNRKLWDSAVATSRSCVQRMDNVESRELQADPLWQLITCRDSVGESASSDGELFAPKHSTLSK